MPTSLTHGVALVERLPEALTERSPVVLVHGGEHGAWVWEPTQEHLAARGYRSVAFDWLSHGDSRRLPEQEWLSRGIPEVAFEIDVACASVADAGAPPIVIGHSMGGLAALAFAAETDRELAAAILLSPVVPAGFADAPIPVPVDETRPFPPFPPAVARQLFWPTVDDETAARAHARLQPESPRAVIQATQWTAEVDLSRIRAPMFLITGVLDELVPPQYVANLADALGAPLLRQPDTGHDVTLYTNPGPLLDLALAWTSRPATAA